MYPESKCENTPVMPVRLPYAAVDVLKDANKWSVLIHAPKWTPAVQKHLD